MVAIDLIKMGFLSAISGVGVQVELGWPRASVAMQQPIQAAEKEKNRAGSVGMAVRTPAGSTDSSFECCAGRNGCMGREQGGMKDRAVATFPERFTS